MNDIQYHAMPDGRRIAFRFTPGAAPMLVFLPGYMSDMAGGKACAVFDLARERGRAALLLDYSGCGESDGDFAEGTLSRWRDEVLALIAVQVAEAKGAAQATQTKDGRVVLIGSSMGGWLMLLVAQALPATRLAGLVGIAAAPDFTQWGFAESDRRRLAAGETILEANDYGPEPTPTHPGFWRDGQDNRLLEQEIAIDCPVRLLHGQDDPDVPWEVSLRLARALRSPAVRITLIKDGDHRLSREEDIALLLGAVEEIASCR